MLSKYILFVNNLLQNVLYNENVYKMRLLCFFWFQLIPHISCNYKKANETKERTESISVTFVAACWMFALALASNTCSQVTNRDYLSSMRLCCDNFRWSSILLRRFEVAVEVSSMKSLVALRLQIREYLISMELCCLWLPLGVFGWGYPLWLW